MSAEEAHIIEIFKTFLEAGLIEHNTQKALSLIADDVIGIGMGSQGFVSCKTELAKILNDGKIDSSNIPIVTYETIYVRRYEDTYATICGVLKIGSVTDGKVIESTLGQLMNIRKQNGKWLICALQATPLFNEIEEMEAYPIKFAENVLEKYRQQEQIAKNAQSDSIAIYRVNFTKGIFEESLLKSDIPIKTENGEQYEKVIFESARRYLSETECYQFMSTFSIGNIFKAYNSGQTELSMSYQMMRADMPPIWLKTIIKLYTDKTDKNLKGYLYVADIDEEKTRELELQSKAQLDSMTSLYNKKYAELEIVEKLKTLSCDSQGAFFMIDLDHFKSINDTYGHMEGDRIIKETAKCIKSLIRRNDIAGRLGGDEFCIYFHGELTPHIIAEKAEILCDEIRRIFPSQQLHMSCSVGIVFCANALMSFDEVYHKADQALYEQKKKGRNGYTIYS